MAAFPAEISLPGKQLFCFVYYFAAELVGTDVFRYNVAYARRRCAGKYTAAGVSVQSVRRLAHWRYRNRIKKSFRINGRKHEYI